MADRFDRTMAVVVVSVMLALTAPRTYASERCPQPVAKIVSTFGAVQYRSAAFDRWQEADLNVLICPEDRIRTGAASRAAIVFLGTNALVRIDHDSELTVRRPAARMRSLLELLDGSIFFFSRTPRALEVQTPYVNAGIEGTEFFVGIAQNRARIVVFEGRVRAHNDQGTIILTNKQAAEATLGQAPKLQTVVKLRDAVQWTLYYPPVFTDPTSRALSALLRRAANLLAAGEKEKADIALKAAPQTSDVLALRAVIAVALGERKQAFDLARRAVKDNPRATAAKIALSYAQQANFDLEAARDTLVEATKQQPEDALAWARLAELWLSLGYPDRAIEAAETATELEPGLSRTNMVLGFAYLSQIRTTKAKAAFEKAIKLDSQDPLARLGLGLAKIRDGDLTDGRQDIEIAVALNPEDGLVRSYMGKTYFEEDRNSLAGQQLEIAKRLDPNDPTPWFYDAIRKQTENRPTEALDDLQASIARNDNRAVYRGRLQLDQDRAARGTSLARIYNDLGFTQLGVREASRSLALDPANAGAHRFLSDNYEDVRRREIARVSELLQAQLLQDININPVQPSISETNLNIITGGGPAEPGFNEFTPLFERNQIQANMTGQVGNKYTLGGEGVVSALYNQFSISAGAFHYETDGFRPNNDINHDIYNLFAQAAVTRELNIQVEVRRRESKEGDLELNFDPDQFLAKKERKLDQDIARVGARYSPTPNSDVLLSLIYTDRKDRLVQTEAVGPGAEITTDALIHDEGYQVEAQYLYRRNPFNVTAGLAFTDVDRDMDSLLTATFPPFILADTTTESAIEHYRGYVYANVNIPDPVTWTAGVSYDHYDEGETHVSRVNPKVGVQWNITKKLRLRGALSQTVKPALVANRTIEPTQVGGFNQFFDDINATKSFRYGGGLDWRLTKNLAVGAEATWRDLDEPVNSGGGVVFEDRNEQLHRAYIYWTPRPGLALSGQFVYDRYKSQAGLDVNLPREVETISVPLIARYFHPSGFFAGVGATYVHQDVDRSNASLHTDGTDGFFTFDAAIGWRLPNRRGGFSLEGRNLFDNEFKFQDDSFREFRDAPSIGPYIPNRTIIGRLTLTF